MTLSGLPAKLLFWLTLFAVAMGFLESAVVVYIREIYYPGGFDFPVVTMDRTLAVTEVLREAATILMLLAAGIVSGRASVEKFAWFIYCFGIWDIFYYVFLKALLAWPESLMTWDILFLIPVVWTGPVIAPVIVSLTMILLALVIISKSYRSVKEVRIGRTVWFLLISGSLVVIASFIWDFSSFLADQIRSGNINGLSRSGISDEIIYSYIPKRFNWWMFLAGELIILTAIYKFALRSVIHVGK